MDNLYPTGYTQTVTGIEVRKTEVYVRWLDSLRHGRARARVLARVERLRAGNPGDVQPVGEGAQTVHLKPIHN